VDLPDALAAPSAVGALPEWRVHFHVPLFAKTLSTFESTFESTQGFVTALLQEHAKKPLSEHLEVETYTWGVLPEALRASSLPDAIARELDFCLDTLRAGKA
jgi:hypothetical protein